MPLSVTKNTEGNQILHYIATKLAFGLQKVYVKKYRYECTMKRRINGDGRLRWRQWVVAKNPLYAHVVHLVKDDQDPWFSFSRVVAENVDIYHKRFRDRLNLVN